MRGTRLSSSKRNIGQVARDAIRSGATDGEALAEVLRLHPGARTTLGSISWYRHTLRRAGEAVPTQREARARPPAQRTAPPPAPKKDRRRAVRTPAIDIVMELLRQGATNRQAYDTARRAYPDADLVPDTVRLCRTKLRRNGELVPTNNEARRAQQGEPFAADQAPRSGLAGTSARA